MPTTMPNPHADILSTFGREFLPRPAKPRSKADSMSDPLGNTGEVVGCMQHSGSVPAEGLAVDKLKLRFR